jgi:hypothetical protein
MAANFGSLVTAGAFQAKNSYFGEEFSVFKTTSCAPAATANQIGSVFARGDAQGGGGAVAACAPSAVPQVANTGELSVSIVGGTSAGGTCQMKQISNTTAYGVEEILATGSATASTKANCLEFLGGGTGLGAPYKPFLANNLPVAAFKVKAGGTGLNAATNGANSEVIVGLSDLGAGQNGMPSNGIFFSNCTAYSTTAPTCPTAATPWQGYVAVGGVLVGSVQACTAAGNLDTANYAYLRIEVRANNDIHFYADVNTSNGINEVECGTGVSGTGPAATALGLTLAANINTNIAVTALLDIDYIRIWQDDPPGGSEPTPPSNGGDVIGESPLTPEDNTATTPDSNQAATSQFIDLMAATSQDASYDHDVYVKGTLFADKIKANQIEGLSIYTDQLASLQKLISSSTPPPPTTTTNSSKSDETESSDGSTSSGSTPGLSVVTVESAKVDLDLDVNGGITVGGTAQFYGNAFFYRLVTFVEKTVFKNDISLESHVGTNGEVLGTKIESAAGITTAPEDQPDAVLATATVDGNDISGQFTLKFGEDSSTGQVLTLKFKKPYAKAPHILLTAANDAAAHVQYYVQSTKDGFTLVVLNSQPTGTSLQFNYWATETQVSTNQ